MANLSLEALLEELRHQQDWLMVQDLDGVCMPLVLDPLTRVMPAPYIRAAASLQGRFCVLTNGEHAGLRGVNPLVERALAGTTDPASEGLYLPGLAAGGVQWQDRFGQITYPGISDAELATLEALPAKILEGLREQLTPLLPELNEPEREALYERSILANPLSPTINLNALFSRLRGDVERQQQLQQRSLALMQTLLAQSEEDGQSACFFLHLAPNLGNSGGVEVLKPAAQGNVGTTDVQFMLRGAVKEAGLLALINQHIASRTGTAPLGEAFNARSAPADHAQLLELCQRSIPVEHMPVLVGVGDTITSEPDGQGGWRRGGSDRGFLTLLQELGNQFGRCNRVVLVDSSAGEVDRPNLRDPELRGLSDPDDPLKPDVLVPGGPDAYVAWFEQLAAELGD